MDIPVVQYRIGRGMFYLAGVTRNEYYDKICTTSVSKNASVLDSLVATCYSSAHQGVTVANGVIASGFPRRFSEGSGCVLKLR